MNITKADISDIYKLLRDVGFQDNKVGAIRCKSEWLILGYKEEWLTDPYFFELVYKDIDHFKSGGYIPSKNIDNKFIGGAESGLIPINNNTSEEKLHALYKSDNYIKGGFTLEDSLKILKKQDSKKELTAKEHIEAALSSLDKEFRNGGIVNEILINSLHTVLDLIQYFSKNK